MRYTCSATMDPTTATPSDRGHTMPNVVLANPLAQTVTVHLRIGGKITALRLDGYAKSAPMPQDALAEHAQALIARGLLRVRKAPEARA